MKEQKITVKPGCYVVIAKRYGCEERHQYLVGVTQDRSVSLKMARTEEEYRGGKYLCAVYWCAFGSQKPVETVSPEPTQPEPQIAKYLCQDIKKCPHLKKAKGAGKNG